MDGYLRLCRKEKVEGENASISLAEKKLEKRRQVIFILISHDDKAV